MDKLHRIYRDIKEVRIQGATNVARAAVEAYSLKPDSENKRALMSLRPTEPTLSNALNFLDKCGKSSVLEHFSSAQQKINQLVLKIIKNGMKIYTHCHSTNVVKALIYAKKKGKKFEVSNTETRPLFQGRVTAKELAAAGIKVTTFVDSALLEAIKGSDIVFLGSDAILRRGFINKVGSAAIAELALDHKKRLYVVADSWKFSPRNVPIEERNFHEVWAGAPRHVKVENPAFAFVDKKFVNAVISELGTLKFDDFVLKAERKLG